MLKIRVQLFYNFELMSNPNRNIYNDARVSRTSAISRQGQLSSRNMNDNYYSEIPSNTNYSSRQYQPGIFANTLNKMGGMGKKKEAPNDLQIEVIQVENFHNSKVKSSKKQYENSRQSREQSYNDYNESANYNVNEQRIKEDIQNQMKFMRNQIQFNLLDKMKKMLNQQSSKVRQSITDIITQINNGFKKKQETIYYLKTQAYTLRQQVTSLNKNFQSFYSQSEQKFENLHVELSNLSGVKKSRVNGQYNMDLKNSFQGLNSSLSVNMGNESQSSKLVNEVIFQLDSLKKQIAENKNQIEEMSSKLQIKFTELKTQTKDKIQSKGQTFKFQEISKLVKDLLKEDKKTSKIDEKMQLFENRFRQNEMVMCNQEQNIKGMNDQLANTINNQINPKLKKIESSLVDLYSRVDLSEIEKLVKTKITQEWNDKMRQTKTVKIRNCNKSQSNKLSVLTGINEDKISYKQTYFLDEENYLLDCQGNYLVEEVNSRKQRIKIQNQFVYLLQQKGIQISSPS